jgi:predicted fused transcriptional regulator/phosphomethylpyrimidine kinase
MRFALTCRHGSEVQAALAEMDGAVAAVDRREGDDAWPPAETAVREAVAETEGRPVALTDPGGPGVSARTVLLASGAKRLAGRALSVRDHLE